ncbi:hypothetical protein HII31_01051 [Pseudocercospora fuligena]|uniref:BTB domain-containing protein n=1 Tax=Pseudocercospora fuligena TaxID=685502 RepID=A0A8H6VM80_9PEZI|nr:hypothetical protein HII31_01051 [Pseudocercospora fuligena]
MARLGSVPGIIPHIDPPIMVDATNMPPPVINIAQHGDLILDLSAKRPKTKLLVSSIVLKGISPVFARLMPLSLRFPDSDNEDPRSAKKQHSVTIHDDDATAMTNMCSMLHARPVTFLTSPRFYFSEAEYARMILSLAQTIKKYECVDILRLQCQGLIWEFLNEYNGTATATCIIAHAAWILNLERAFCAATKHVAFDDDEFPTLKDSTLPKELYYPLQHKYLSVQDTISRGTLGILKGACKCSIRDVTEKCRKQLDDAELHYFSPGDQIEPSQLIMRLPNLIGEERYWCDGTCGEVAKVTRNEVQSFIAKIEKLCEGLCLRCLRENKLIDPTESCSELEHRHRRFGY